MKKLFAILFSVILLTLWVSTSLAVTYYDSLGEKFYYQLRKGSGLTGAFQVTIDSDTLPLSLLRPLSGVQWQIRSIQKPDGTFSFECFLPDGDGKQLVTTMTGNPDGAYLKSDLLIDTVLRLPVHADWLTTLLSVDGESNPSWLSALDKLAAIDEETWDRLLAPYLPTIEEWASAYVDMTTDGSQTFTVGYSIPASAVLTEARVLLPAVLADEALIATVSNALTEEQQAAYLNPDRIWYYDGILESFPLTDSIRLQRQLSASGKVLLTRISFPVVIGSWTEFTLEITEGATTATLESNDDAITLTVAQPKTSENTVSRDGTLMAEHSGKILFDAAFHVTVNTEKSVDDEQYTHEVQDITLSLIDQGDATFAFGELSARFRLHWSSKSLNNQPTTLDAAFACSYSGNTVSVSAKLRSTAPWTPEVISMTEDAVDLTTVSAAKRSEYIADLFANTLAVLSSMKETEEPVPVQTEIPVEEEIVADEIVEEEAAEADDIPAADETAAETK